MTMSTFISSRSSMTTSEMFSSFLGNLVINNRDLISDRYERITSALNREFRDTDSKTANSLQIGSYGRRTGIKGLSDLDMIYILPKREWDSLKNDQYKALYKTKKAIEKTYKTTSINVDRLVVVVKFENYVIEVQPCFEQSDGSFLYPNTYRNQWLPTMPRQEIAAVDRKDNETNGNLRDLCKIARAWRNMHGLKMGGLLVDTLAYQFLNSTSDYNATGASSHDQMFRNFVVYLTEQPTDKSYYKAPGSSQNVRLKKKFHRKAKKTLNLIDNAIAANGQINCNNKWRKIFGRPFPPAKSVSKSAYNIEEAKTWSNTEEFIEDRFLVDIRFDLKIDCKVSQHGHRSFNLHEFLKKKLKLHPFKSLRFEIIYLDSELKQPYEIYWKVLNRGERAKALNKIRGQIVIGGKTKSENTQFRGGHLVECYVVQNEVVVAKDRIDVPIQDQ